MSEKQTAPRGQRGAANETQRVEPVASSRKYTPIYAGARVMGTDPAPAQLSLWNRP